MQVECVEAMVLRAVRLGEIMKTYLKIAAVAAAGIAATSPAYAATQLCAGGGCQPNPDSNVLFVDNSVGTTIEATLNNNPALVTFTSTEELGTQANGQATLFATDGTLNSDVTIFSTTNLISALELNLDALTEGTATFTFFGGSNDLLGTTTQTLGVGENGSNFFNTFGGDFQSVTISLGGGATLADINQVRITAGVAAAVPEPATWAMFLMGFGAVGYSMRSRKAGYRAVQAV
jgi:hypothetical protein